MRGGSIRSTLQELSVAYFCEVVGPRMFDAHAIVAVGEPFRHSVAIHLFDREVVEPLDLPPKPTISSSGLSRSAYCAPVSRRLWARMPWRRSSMEP